MIIEKINNVKNLIQEENFGNAYTECDNALEDCNEAKTQLYLLKEQFVIQNEVTPQLISDFEGLLARAFGYQE